MNFKKSINVVHDLIITAFIGGGLFVLIAGDLIGAVIMLLAMIEDNVYRRR